MSTDISKVADQLVGRLAGYGAVAVAFSGGVDSAVVAKAAVLAMGARSVAVTAISPSLAAFERTAAVATAEQIGIRHVELSTNEFDRTEYRANAGDRCFYCKDTLYSLASTAMQKLNVEVIVNGANTDDLGDHRPGMRAASNHNVRSPLIEENINKDTVRALARWWNLDVAEKPASPCLASRIAYGVEVTPERVERVDRAETFIRTRTGIQQLRVRYEAGDLARIEVPVNQIGTLITDPLRAEVADYLQLLGFRQVTIDMNGFRSGSLNSSLTLVSLGNLT